MKHLVQTGPHACPLPCGEDDDGEMALVAHGAEQWHGKCPCASQSWSGLAGAKEKGGPAGPP
jgi:hypothetical protein